MVGPVLDLRLRDARAQPLCVIGTRIETVQRQVRSADRRSDHVHDAVELVVGRGEDQIPHADHHVLAGLPPMRRELGAQIVVHHRAVHRVEHELEGLVEVVAAQARLERSQCVGEFAQPQALVDVHDGGDRGRRGVGRHDGSTEGVADHHRCDEVLGRNDRSDVSSHRERAVVGRVARFAVTPQVERDAPVVGRQPVDDRRPVGAAVAETVHEHDRWSVAPHVVRDLDPVVCGATHPRVLHAQSDG